MGANPGSCPRRGLKSLSVGPTRWHHLPHLPCLTRCRRPPAPHAAHRWVPARCVSALPCVRTTARPAHIGGSLHCQRGIRTGTWLGAQSPAAGVTLGLSSRQQRPEAVRLSLASPGGRTGPTRCLTELLPHTPRPGSLPGTCGHQSQVLRV